MDGRKVNLIRIVSRWQSVSQDVQVHRASCPEHKSKVHLPQLVNCQHGQIKLIEQRPLIQWYSSSWMIVCVCLGTSVMQAESDLWRVAKNRWLVRSIRARVCPGGWLTDRGCVNTITTDSLNIAWESLASCRSINLNGNVCLHCSPKCLLSSIKAL